MKKIVIFSFVVALWTLSIMPAFALLRRDLTAVEGLVLVKKEVEKQVTVRNNSTGTDETFNADDAQMASMREGDTVLILHQINSPTISTMVVTQQKP